MAEIRSLLEKYNIVAQRDEELEIPHILYERRGLDGKVIISKNFILEYDMLLQKKYIRPEKLEESFYQFPGRFAEILHPFQVSVIFCKFSAA